MVRIEKAGSGDLQKISDMAEVVFRHTYREILSPEQLRESIARVFAAKGDKVVEDNLKAFDLGLNE